MCAPQRPRPQGGDTAAGQTHQSDCGADTYPTGIALVRGHTYSGSRQSGVPGVVHEKCLWSVGPLCADEGMPVGSSHIHQRNIGSSVSPGGVWSCYTYGVASCDGLDPIILYSKIFDLRCKPIIKLLTNAR